MPLESPTVMTLLYSRFLPFICQELQKRRYTQEINKISRLSGVDRRQLNVFKNSLIVQKSVSVFFKGEIAIYSAKFTRPEKCGLYL